MHSEILDQLTRLEGKAAPAPWVVVQLNDNSCMSMVAITNGDMPAHHLAGGDWEGSHILAATLIQDPPYVVPQDQRWNENAALIAEVRNNLPELIRLARLGLAAEAHDA